MSDGISPYPNSAYTVGWISALPVEFAAAKGMLDEDHGHPQEPPPPADKNTYALGRIGKFKVVIACLPKHEIGSSSAAVVAKDMLFTFPSIRIGLLVGIGAGIPDYESEDIQDVRLGDIVISSDKENGGVVVYDFGKRLPDGSFQSLYALDRPPRALRTAISRIEAEHEMRENRISQYIGEMIKKYPLMKKKGYVYPGKASDKLFLPDYMHDSGRTCKNCDLDKEMEREPKERPDEKALIHYGVIATGSAVVEHGITRDAIKQEHRAICLEMEAAGLMNNFPCVVIRGISTYADSHKNEKWHAYAAATAAACAKELLDYVQPTSIDQEAPAKDTLEKIAKDVSNIEKQVSKITAVVNEVERAAISRRLIMGLN